MNIRKKEKRSPFTEAFQFLPLDKGEFSTDDDVHLVTAFQKVSMGQPLRREI